jgi:hypothetical protein
MAKTNTDTTGVSQNLFNFVIYKMSNYNFQKDGFVASIHMTNKKTGSSKVRL